MSKHINLSKRRVSLFDIPIHDVTLDEAVEVVTNSFLPSDGRCRYIVLPNAIPIVQLKKDQLLRKIYREADLVLADGMILVWLSRILGVPLRERVTGADFSPRLCARAADRGYKVFLLCANPRVAARAADRLKSRYPGLQIDVYSPPYGFELSEEENGKVVNLIKRSRPDILFVALGCPKQERWIYNHAKECKVPVSIGVGAAFDYLAGTLKRAPRWMQRWGLEWLYRLLQEPRRLWYRYLVLGPQFVLLSLREIFKIKILGHGKREGIKRGACKDELDQSGRRALTLSIVIPTKNRSRALKSCVESIQVQSRLPQELVIVDQSETPEMGDWLKTTLSGVPVILIYIHNNRLSGLTQARNEGIKRSQGDIIMFLDDDVILEDDYIAQIMKIYEQDKEEEIGGLSGRIVNPDITWGRWLFTNVFFHGPFRGERQMVNLWWRGRPKSRANQDRNQSALIPTPCLSGGDFSFRRHIFQDFRFDESLTGYARGEDQLFSYQVSRRYPLFFAPTAKLYHNPSLENRPVKERMYESEILFRFRFIARYARKDPLTLLCYLWWNLGMVVRAGLRLWRPSLTCAVLRGYLRVARVLLQRSSFSSEFRQALGQSDGQDNKESLG